MTWEYDDGSKFGYTCHYADGTKETNLTYMQANEILDSTRDSDNPCVSITPPGYGEDCDPSRDRRNL